MVTKSPLPPFRKRGKKLPFPEPFILDGNYPKAI
jgi:hypothetical protein